MWFVEVLRHTPALAVFLTIGIGFWLGKLKFKGMALGTVTSVLIVGVLVGQLDIEVGGPLKSVSFLLFLFCIGYSVGPQFFRSLKGEGLREVLFAVVVCGLILGVSWIVALLFGLNPGQAAGMMAGASTASPVVGAAEDTINTLPGSNDAIASMVAAIPVCYAMTYVFGTLGAVWLLGYVGPAMMGGIDKVRAMTRELEKTLSPSDSADDPQSFNAVRLVAFRAYRADGPWVGEGRSIGELEAECASQGKRVTIERIKRAGDGQLLDKLTPDTIIEPNDIVAIAARREMIVTDLSWFGSEVPGVGILNFPVRDVNVTVSRHCPAATVRALFDYDWMDGVDVKRLIRDGRAIDPMHSTSLQAGDVVELVGSASHLKRAAQQIGFADTTAVATDFVFIGLGILLGGLLGALAIKIGGVTVSLGASGGALIAGLDMGWL